MVFIQNNIDRYLKFSTLQIMNLQMLLYLMSAIHAGIAHVMQDRQDEIREEQARYEGR
jgi:hypothetical protein